MELLSHIRGAQNVAAGCLAGMPSISKIKGVVMSDDRRAKYDPALHENHKRAWSDADDDYLKKFYKVDGMAHCALALGRTEMALSNRYRYLKARGLV